MEKLPRKLLEARKLLERIQFRSSPPAARALELGLVTKTDLLRLKAIARLHARALPGWITWIDLLQEAFARMLEGKRRRPPDVPIVAFIAEVMRSLRSDHLRRARRERLQSQQLHAVAPAMNEPEEQLLAEQELARIQQLFATDPSALQVIAGLAAGFTPEEIRERHALSPTDYDSTRRRIRRVLLREGLRYEPA